jgi:hypothetical protein
MNFPWPLLRSNSSHVIIFIFVHYPY